MEERYVEKTSGEQANTEMADGHHAQRVDAKEYFCACVYMCVFTCYPGVYVRIFVCVYANSAPARVNTNARKPTIAHIHR